MYIIRFALSAYDHHPLQLLWEPLTVREKIWSLGGGPVGAPGFVKKLFKEKTTSQRFKDFFLYTISYLWKNRS